MNRSKKSKHHKARTLVGSVTLLALGCAITACSSAPPPPPDEPAHAVAALLVGEKQASRASTEKTGVIVWKIFRSEDGVIIRGQDAAGDTVGTFRARALNPDGKSTELTLSLRDGETRTVVIHADQTVEENSFDRASGKAIDTLRSMMSDLDTPEGSDDRGAYMSTCQKEIGTATLACAGAGVACAASLGLACGITGAGCVWRVTIAITSCS